MWIRLLWKLSFRSCLLGASDATRNEKIRAEKLGPITNAALVSGIPLESEDSWPYDVILDPLAPA
jgi:hypothetical protein